MAVASLLVLIEDRQPEIQVLKTAKRCGFY